MFTVKPEYVFDTLCSALIFISTVVCVMQTIAFFRYLLVFRELFARILREINMKSSAVSFVTDCS